MRILLMVLKQYLIYNIGAQVNIVYMWCCGYVPEKKHAQTTKTRNLNIKLKISQINECNISLR